MVEESGYLCVQIMMPFTKDVAVGTHQGIIEFKVSTRACRRKIMLASLTIYQMHALEEDE